MTFVCLDVGGTNTLLGLGNSDFEVVEEMKTKEFLENPAKHIDENIQDTKHRREEIEDVAVAVAGTLNRDKGIFYPPNIESMDQVQIVEPLREYGSVNIVNDCTSAVAGEYYYGDRNYENIVYITISSGIGAGAIIDGEIKEGWKGNVGEIGHLITGSEGVECGCGGSDHWEAYSSGNRMPRMAKNLYDAEFEDSIEIFEKHEKGHPKASKVINKMQSKNARGLSNVINVFNPEAVLIGGAVALNHYDTVIGDVLEEVEQRTKNDMPKIEKCSLGQRAVIHGLRAACNGKLD